MKNIDTFITSLSTDVSAQKTVRLSRLMTTWFLGTFIYMALLLFVVFKPRPDLALKLSEPLFFFEISSLALLALTSSLSAILLSFPDSYQNRKLSFTPIAAFIFFALSLALEQFADNPPAPEPEHSFECCIAITLASLPLAAWMFARIYRMAPVHPTFAGATALLASFSIGALALRLSEQTDSIHHLIYWHYLPMFLMGLIGLWLGQKILKW
jgi:hypothetical protein